MKYLIGMVWCAALTILSSVAMASTFRCDSQLVSMGDRAFDVLRKCGEPVTREALGFTVSDYNHRELPIEEWIYGPKGGMYYYLRFIGGELVKISSSR